MFREDNSPHGKQISTIKNKLWGVVLAGGEGTRLRNLVTSLYGYNRPKQFCTLIGKQSLIKHTLNRASKIISPKNILTVVTRHHSKFYKEELRNQPEESILVQPCPRDTSAGILLSVSKIYNSDPDSTVVIFPSDHFILEENKFVNYVKKACLFVDMNPDLIVLVGIKPDKIEPGLGWIERGNKINSVNNFNFNRVQKFWEKPDSATTTSLFRNGCLINTFIVIGKSQTIIEQMNKSIPELFKAFEPIREKIGTSQERITIERFFKFVPKINFSKDFLTKISNYLSVLEIPDLYWSDWGEEQRVMSDIQRFSLSRSSISGSVTNEILYKAAFS
jgi:mannose-1-phosphate guanylyltransferase